MKKRYTNWEQELEEHREQMTHTHRCQYCKQTHECDGEICKDSTLDPCPDCIKKGYDR